MTTTSTTSTSPTGPSGGDQSTTDQAKQQAVQAKEQAQQVAGTAADEAKNVAGEAKAQARNLVGELRTQVEDQSRTQRDSLVGLLRNVSDDLDEMAAQRGDGPAGEVVRQVSQRARRLSESIDGREPEDLLADIRSMARQRPGMFLLGSLAAGVVAGRLLRGARDASSGTGMSSSYPYADVPSAGYPASPAMTSPSSATGSTMSPGGDPLTDPLADPLAGPGVTGTTGAPGTTGPTGGLGSAGRPTGSTP